MRINVTPSFISKLVKNWDNEDTQEMIEAIVAELKKDCREDLRHCYGSKRDELEGWWEDLIGQVQNEDFWCQMDHLLNFYFEY